MTREEQELLIRRIVHIIERCDKDIEEDTWQTRDVYNMIRAFHYDAISKLVKKAIEKEKETC